MKKDILSGISKNGILADIRKKISEEQEVDVKNILRLEIARYSFLVATRLEAAKDVAKSIKLSAALTLLSQAQTLTSTDNREARKLFNLARRLGK
jgi:hypothetical protein